MTQPHDNTNESELDSARVSSSALLEDVIEPVVASMGYELVVVQWSGSGRHRRCQVFVDHPDGITVEDCARLSPLISNALDAAEADPEMPQVRRVLSGAYMLEVSSPGLDRPLSRRAHFERNVGAKATVRTHAPVEPDSNQKTFHGRIEAVEADAAAPDDPRRGTVLLHDPDTKKTHRIALFDIKRANLVYEG